MSRFIWHPPQPTGDLVLEWNKAEPFMCVNPQGLLRTVSDLATHKAPGQRGETLDSISVQARVITLPVVAAANTRNALWPLRSELARAFSTNPTRIGQQPVLGQLVLERDGQETLEMSALPRQGPIPTGRSFPLWSMDAPYAYVEQFDVELLCPAPEWRAQGDNVIELKTANAGLQFPIQFSFESGSSTLEQDVYNDSDVDTPILARMHGDATGLRIRNLTYNETIAVTGQVVAGNYIEVDTEFGYKYVEEVVESTGVRTDALGRLDLTTTTMWYLRPGIQRVRFEADVNASGRALLAFRRRYSGV